MFKVGDCVKLINGAVIDTTGYHSGSVESFFNGNYESNFYVRDIDDKGRIGISKCLNSFKAEIYFSPDIFEIVATKSQLNENESAQELTKLEYAAIHIFSNGYRTLSRFEAVKLAKEILEVCNEQ